jgi:hypothetical protein
MLKYKNFLEKIPKFLLSWFVFDIILLIVWLSGPDNNNKVVATAVLTVGLLSFLFYEENNVFTNWLARNNRFVFLKFMSLGLIGAIVVEFIFWFWERAFGVLGVVANHDLFINWLVTLPIYFFVLLSFWFIQKRKNYSLGRVFVIGGIYELIAEGLIGGFFKGSILLGLVYGLIGLPIFMVVYSLMLLPPAIFLKKIRSRGFNNASINIK